MFTSRNKVQASGVLNNMPISNPPILWINLIPACFFKLTHGLELFAIFVPHRPQLHDAPPRIAAGDLSPTTERQAGFLGPFVGALFAADGGVELVMRRTAEMVAGFVREGERDALNADCR